MAGVTGGIFQLIIDEYVEATICQKCGGYPWLLPDSRAGLAPADVHRCFCQRWRSQNAPALRTKRTWVLMRTDHELCSRGQFRLVRHPIYLAIDLLALGVAIWLPKAAVIIASTALIIGSDVRARTEEKVLFASFGDRYRDYAKRVRRTIPGLY